ncbi:hypothetical protein M8C21_016030, partial [Ambrosia artemisiifolia]
YTHNVLSSSIGWVVALIQLPPRFDYLRLHVYAGLFPFSLCHLTLFLLFLLYTCSHPLPHTSPVPCLLPFPKISFTSYKKNPHSPLSSPYFSHISSRYRIPVTIDDKTALLDAIIFDRAATQLLGMPSEDMFAKPNPHALIHEITAKPIQFTIRAVKDDRTALTTFLVNSAVRLQPDQNADTSSSSNIQPSATPTPLTPAPANPSATEKKGRGCTARTEIRIQPKGQPLTSKPAAAKSERH